MAGKGSSNVGVLTVFMDAITDQFHAGLNKAESAIGTFKGKLRGMSNALKDANEAMRNAEAALRVFKAASDLVNAETYEDINAAWIGIGDAITALPGPLGEAASLVRNILFTLTGAREEMDALAEAAASNAAEERIWIGQWEKFMRLRGEYRAQTFTMFLEEEGYWKRVVGEGKEAADNWRNMYSFSEEHRNIVGEISDLLAGQGKFADMAEQDRESLLKDLRDQQKVAYRIWQLRLKADAAAKVAAAAKVVSDKADADADDAKRIREERLGKLKQAMNAMARLHEKRTQAAGRSLAGGANTFTSPMGTISLPALNQTAELAAKQVTELQTINAAMRELEKTIAELRK